MIETVRLRHHSPYLISSPEVDVDIQTWYCCRPWPIVIASTTYSGEWPKREAWFVRNCKLCGRIPRPQEET